MVTHKDRYEVALICGVVDSSRERLGDSRISVSTLFVIRPQPMHIVVPYRKEMLEFLMQPRKSGGVWMQAALLPKGFDTSRIFRVSDVEQNGGRWFGFESRVTMGRTSE
jgi:hypothetical protein